MNYNANISNAFSGKPYDRRLNVIKSFYVKFKRKIPGFVEDLSQSYVHYPLLVNEGTALPLAAITVVELKRPMRDNAQNGETDNLIEQALGYLERIREGNATNPQGRPIPALNDIHGFCYIICDLTPTIKKYCKNMGCLQEYQDKMGYFCYHSNYKLSIEIISFNKLVRQAKERNIMFFQKLGIPTGL